MNESYVVIKIDKSVWNQQEFETKEEALSYIHNYEDENAKFILITGRDFETRFFL